MKYLYILVLTIFLASCSVNGAVENNDLQISQNNKNTETNTGNIVKERKVDTFSGETINNNSGELMTLPDWNDDNRPEPPEWGDNTQRPESPTRGERNTKSGIDTSTSAS